MVTTFHPDTHYARYLCSELAPRQNLVVLTMRDEPTSGNREVCTVPCWRRGPEFVSDVLEAVDLQKADLVHLQHEFNMYGGLAGALRFLRLLGGLRRRRKTIVLTLHSVIAPSEVTTQFVKLFGLPRFRFGELFAALAFGFFYKVACRLSHRVIVHSYEALDKLCSHYGLSYRKGTVVRHGVSRQQEPPVQRQAESRSCVLSFGYVVPRKGLETLIHAFSIVRSLGHDLDLVIAGGVLPGHETYVTSLKAEARRGSFGADIRFTGFLSEPEIHRLYDNASVFVLPYRVSIASSGPMALAVQHAVPSIATNTPFFREISRDHDFLELVPSDAATELANAIIRIITDKPLAERMRSSARAASHAWGWDRIAEQTVEEYEVALSA